MSVLNPAKKKKSQLRHKVKTKIKNLRKKLVSQALSFSTFLFLAFIFSISLCNSCREIAICSNFLNGSPSKDRTCVAGSANLYSSTELWDHENHKYAINFLGFVNL